MLVPFNKQKQRGYWPLALLGGAISLMCLLCIGLPYQQSNAKTVHGHRPLVLNLTTEPPTLDPLMARDMVSINVINNLMQGLLAYDAKGKLVGACAKRWHASPDGKTYTFLLRPNARWSDGKPVTAPQFVSAFERALNPKTGAPYAFLLFYLKKGQAYYNQKITDFAHVGIKAMGSHKLVMTLDQPVAFFPNILAFPVTFPQRNDVIAAHPQNWTEAGKLVSNGPYQLKHWQHDDELVLESNPYYFGPPPQNKTVQMLMIPDAATSLMMYEAGELDFVETVSSLPLKDVRRLMGRPDFKHFGLHAIAYLGFNTQKAPMNNPLVRQALAAALDKTAFPKLFKSGEQPINSWISPGLLGYNPKLGITYNVEKAQALLKQAGYPQGKGFPQLTFSIPSGSTDSSQLAEVVQAQWQQHLGINVQIKRLEWKVYLKQLDEDPPPIFRLQWYVDYPDPDSFMNVFLSDSGNSYLRWKDVRYDALVKRAALEQTPMRRVPLYNQAQKILLEEQTALIPLYVIPKAYLLKPTVKGLRLNALNLMTLE